MITKEKIYFDKEGNLYLPNSIKFWGEADPPLKVKEWWFLVLSIADKTALDDEKIRHLYKVLIGSKATQYRIRKSLRRKGYL